MNNFLEQKHAMIKYWIIFISVNYIFMGSILYAFYIRLFMSFKYYIYLDNIYFLLTFEKYR